MDIPSIHQETGAFWNEIADTYSHGKQTETEVIAHIQSGGNYLLDSERRLLWNLKAWCRRAIHLQCSGGLDALSLLKLGATEVVGIDISERLLDSARRKSEALGASASWHCCDVLHTPDLFNSTADLVYTGKGALCWMMDLTAWAAVVARLLAPGGRLFIDEAHPLNWVWDTNAPDYQLDPKDGNYFSTELKPGLFGRKTEAVPRAHHWTLAQIVSSVIGVGLRIETLQEYAEPFWNEFPNMPPQTLHRLPHAFALMAVKG